MVEIYYETWGVHWCNKKICDLEYEWVDFVTSKNATNACRRVLLAEIFFQCHVLLVSQKRLTIQNLPCIQYDNDHQKCSSACANIHLTQHNTPESKLRPVARARECAMACPRASAATLVALVVNPAVAFTHRRAASAITSTPIRRHYFYTVAAARGGMGRDAQDVKGWAARGGTKRIE